MKGAARKHHARYHAAGSRLYRQLGPGFVRVAAIVAVAALGAYLIHVSHAATAVGSSEAESGMLSNGASAVTDPLASGGQAVMFGSTVPTDLQVFTGGNNIALAWDMPPTVVQSVQVWRNDTQIATVSPRSDVSIQNQQLGKEYDDNSVTAGGTYQYKVRAVLSNGAVSAFTPTVSATQPTNSAPVPTITVDTTGISAALANYMQTYIVPLLKTWYPKDADELAYPAYTPPTNLTINFNLNDGNYCETAASGNTGTISCDPNQVAATMTESKNDTAAAFVHESTHVIQDDASGPGWTIEGGASWASDYYARQNINSYVPHTGDQIGPYTPGAWFIEFVRENYNASFPRDLNVAIHNGTYSDSLFSQDTGGKLTSEAQAWQTAVNAYNSSIGTVAGTSGKCVEVQNGTVANGTKLVLDSCNGSSASQQWALTYHNPNKAGFFEISSPMGNETGASYCMDDQSSGTADGTIVQYWGCDQTDAQYWRYDAADGTIVNVNAGKCLSTQGGSTANGTQLVIRTCDGGADQKWTVPGS